MVLTGFNWVLMSGPGLGPRVCAAAGGRAVGLRQYLTAANSDRRRHRRSRRRVPVQEGERKMENSRRRPR